MHVNGDDKHGEFGSVQRVLLSSWQGGSNWHRHWHRRINNIAVIRIHVVRFDTDLQKNTLQQDGVTSWRPAR